MGKSGSEQNIQFNKTWWCRRSTPLSPSNFVGNPLPSFPQQLCRSKSATSWNLRLRISAVKADAKKSPRTMMRHAEICGLGIWFPVSWNQSPTILDFSHVFFGRRDRYEKTTLFWAETCVRGSQKLLVRMVGNVGGKNASYDSYDISYG